MGNANKTFYLWDLANTLFPEVWDKEKSGFEGYDEYVKSLGFDLASISPKDYEWTYEVPYKTGLFDLSLAEGFKETLSWTKNNIVFTTGNKEQVDWRQQQLGKKYNLDIRDYLTEIHSTFDYGNTNKKTTEMLIDILKAKHGQGYTTAVYADDNQKNCEFFIDAVKAATGQGIKIDYRVYNIKYGLPVLQKINKNYFKIGSLLQLLAFEKAL